MLKLCSKISITFANGSKTVEIPYCTEVEVITSINNFTDTAKVTLPRKTKINGSLLHTLLKKGDAITIQLGYNEYYRSVFNGYIRKVVQGTPLVLECENEAFKLKQIKLSKKTYSKLSIKDFCTTYVKGYTMDIADFQLGEVRINEDVTLAKCFDYFITNYPCKFFFRDGGFYGVLPSSMAYKAKDVNVVELSVGKNVITDETTYELAEDVNLQIICKVILKNNTKLESKRPALLKGEKADNGTEVRTFFCPTATTQKELDAMAENYLKTFKVDRITGDITTFGEPYVRKLDIVHFYSEEFPEKNDKKFIVEDVTYTFGQGGYRQRIKLGGQIK